MLIQLLDAGLPEPYVQFKACEGRRFRWDFAYLQTPNGNPCKFLVEIDGNGPGHYGFTGVRNDHEKRNIAVMLGYDQLSFTTNNVDDGSAITMIIQFLKDVDDGKRG